jgi:PAS domain S-box-containing protein
MSSRLQPRKKSGVRPQHVDDQLQVIAETIPEMLWKARADGFLDYCNKRWLQFTGLDFEEALGWGWQSAIHPSDLSLYVERMQAAVMEGKHEFEIECRLRKANGVYLWHLVHGGALLNKNGGISGWFGTCTNIHEQRVAQAELQEKELRLRTLAKHVPAIVWIANANGDIDFINDRWFDYTGLTLESTINRSWVSVVHPEDLARGLLLWKEVIAAGSSAELEMRVKRHSDGKFRWHLARVEPIKDKAGKVTNWVGTIIDVDEQKSARVMLQLVMDTIPQAIWWKDKNSAFLGCNRNFASNAGFSNPSEMIGKTDYEMPWRKEESDYFRQCDRRVMESDEPEFHVIEPKLMADGKEAWLDTSKIPLHDAEGNVVGTLGTYQDITERVKLIQQREDFMASLAHDLKVPIVGAVRALEILLGDVLGPVTEEQKAFISKLHKSQSHLLHLIQNLLQVLRYEVAADELRLEEANFSELLKACLGELQSLVEAKDLTTNISVPGNISLQADKVAIKRVLQNLLSNAIKFTPNSGRIDVSAHIESDNLVFAVRDTGPGISKEDQTRLFQRFWQGGTGKRYSAETGLGLYLSRQIAELHGGHIFCESEVGKGTTFRIVMPRTRQKLPTGLRRYFS